MRKTKTYIIDLFDSLHPSARVINKVQDAEFWSSDTDAWLNFGVTSQGFAIDSAEISLYNKNDKSVVVRPMTVVNNEAQFHMEPIIISHFGEWLAQVIFRSGGKSHTSPTVRFTVSRELGADLPERLELIKDWADINDEVKDFIAEIEGFTLGQFVKLKMDEEVADLESNYETRLVDLESNDQTITTQLSNLESNYGTRLANLETNDQTISSQITNLESNYATRLVDLETSDQTVILQLEDLESAYATRLVNLENNEASITTQLTELESDHETRLTGLETNNQTLTTQLTNLESDHNTRLVNLETKDQTITSQLTGLESNHDTRLVDLETKDQTIASQLANLESNHDTRLVDLDKRLTRDYEAITTGTENLLFNSDLSKLPETEVPNGGYSFLIAEGSGPTNDQRALVVATTSYQAGREFAFVLTETVPAGAKVVLKAMVKSNVATQKIKMRMAYTSPTEFTLSANGVWKQVEFEMTAPSDYNPNDFLYIDTGKTSVLEFSNLSVQVKPDVALESLAHMAKKFETINFSNSKGAIESMIGIAQTYQDNLSQLVYGNFKTAYDADPSATNGKYQIDCSSFANLLIQGVPFNQSRHKKDKNTKSRWGFGGYDPSAIRYSNQIAKWAYDRGYAFKPEPDFSNVQPGDFIFYRWDNFEGDPVFRRRSFMEIDHVGVYLDKQSDSVYKMLQLDNGFTSVHFNASGNYMSQAILVARFPLANVESALPSDNLILDGNTPRSTSNSSTVNVYNLKRLLEKGKYYTVVLDGEVNTPGAYFVIQNGRYETIESQSNPTDKTKHIFRFLYQGEDASGLAVSIGAPAGTPASRNASVNWIKLIEGYAINEEPASELQVKRIMDLPADLEAALKPYARYTKSDTLVNMEISLPFVTAKTGRFVFHTLTADARPQSEVRMPALLQSPNGGVHMGAISVYAEGMVSVLPYTNEPYTKVLATGNYSLI